VASDVKVVSDNQLLISHNEMVKTIENLKANNKVCVTAFDEDWKGVRIYGTAEYFNSGKWLDKVVELFTNDHTEPKGAILVTATKVSELS
jgi:general stress protein 26